MVGIALPSGRLGWRDASPSGLLAWRVWTSEARVERRAGGPAVGSSVGLVPPSLVAEIEREDLPYAVGEEPPRAVIDETCGAYDRTGAVPDGVPSLA